ncbi:VirB3 family type IV secretion system protein [Paraburkholderia flagellata]|uniref:VirB3 family type IV secretion system protein n=1 Tax=Paraburkholderia flagellata TaxID=2883241 RepID=UPI001F439442|nr:VirB3 family type IV secretion system protein [Paraburkholderia flagellata]
MEEKTLYPSYAGLARTPMVLGIPLMAALIVFVVSLVVSVVGGATLGPGGLLFGCVGAPVLLYLKQLCATDDQALRILGLELRCMIQRRFFSMFGKTFTLAPIRYGRQLSTYSRAHRELGTPSTAQR